MDTKGNKESAKRRRPKRGGGSQKRSRSEEQARKGERKPTRIHSVDQDSQSKRQSGNRSPYGDNHTGSQENSRSLSSNRQSDNRSHPRNNDKDTPISSKKKQAKKRNHWKRHGRQQSENSKNSLPKIYFKPDIAIPNEEADLKVLVWNSPTNHVPFASEEAMFDVLMPRKRNERGMMYRYAFRVREINEKLKAVGGMTLLQALSLRRHYIRKFNPWKSMATLGLGTDLEIRESAAIFEECVQEFLKDNNIPYWTEGDQRRMFKAAENAGVLCGTPDFFLQHQVLLKKVSNGVVAEERKINWIEAKMFYGASTIPQGSPGAVGSLVPKLKKYVEAFGPGATCFMNGCGDRLAAELEEIGVSVLDCSGSVDIGRVQEHQRKWCATRDGRILN
eukprot:scaffold721_cov131-Cylindrotheca_fusiformis.AAC.61